MAETSQISDPTSLTTGQIVREGEHLKELLVTRIEGIEKAVEVAHDDLVRVPTEVQKAVEHLKGLHEEKFETVSVKFEAVQQQFDERDERARQDKDASATALNAALASQKELFAQQTQNFKEATEKSDKQFKEQIDAQANLISTEVKGLVAQIGEVKERFSRGEAKGEGVKEHKTDIRIWLALIVAAIGVIFGIVMAIIKVR